MDVEKLKSISKEIDAFEANSPKATEEFKNAFLSKKGAIKSLFVQLKEAPPEKISRYKFLRNLTPIP